MPCKTHDTALQQNPEQIMFPDGEKKKKNCLLILFRTKVTIVLCIVYTAKAAQAATHWRVM